LEALVRADLVDRIAAGIDTAALSGTGASNQPRGIANTTNINAIQLGANGGALSYSNLVAMIGALGAANVDMDGNALAWIMDWKTASAVMNISDSANRPLFLNYNSQAFITNEGLSNNNLDAIFLGYKAYKSNNARSNLTKGTATGLSELFFGRWADIIIGEWGVLEVVANPWGQAFASGGLQIRAIQIIDVGIRHPQSFAYINDIIA